MPGPMRMPWADAPTGRLWILNGGHRRKFSGPDTGNAAGGAPNTPGLEQAGELTRLLPGWLSEPQASSGEPSPSGCALLSLHSLLTSHTMAKDAGIGATGLATLSEALVARALCLLPLGAVRVPVPLTFSLLSPCLDCAVLLGLGVQATREEMKHAPKLLSCPTTSNSFSYPQGHEEPVPLGRALCAHLAVNTIPM